MKSGDKIKRCRKKNIPNSEKTGKIYIQWGANQIYYKTS